MIKSMTVAEKIKQRRLQMIVHSTIYYIYNDNIVSDIQWSKWAKELETLQNRYPEISSGVEYAEYFKDWDGSTGFNLPIDDEWALRKAEQLMKWRERSTSKRND